jgi:formamidopyrimidine-DNA glycosylase
MPELPDVEIFRRYFNRTSLNRRIESVNAHEARVLEGVSGKKLSQRLEGLSFTASTRRGKHMFAKLSDGGWLMLHFGMTGFLKYYKDENSAPEHPRVVFEFDNGYRLAWDSRRMIGRVSLTGDPDEFAAKNDLGPDAMNISKEEFLELMRGKRGMIKTALMDQSLIAGIGNVYSDEMLFQTGVHPKTKVGDLSDDTLGKLYDNMRKVFETVIESSIDPAEMPDWLMTAHRGRDNDCPGCKGKMEKIRISGRNGYICKKCQKK